VDVDKIAQLVNESLTSHELDDCFLIEVKINGNRVEVYLDSDDQVTFAKCRKVSRDLEEVLDSEKWFGEKYTLDVSSAGVGRPLMYPRQYVKNIGRTITVKSVEGEKYSGKIVSADDEGIEIEWVDVVKEGKKKKKVNMKTGVAYDQISEARIKVSFK
jgi:ribosome maturation factor RimP